MVQLGAHNLATADIPVQYALVHDAPQLYSLQHCLPSLLSIGTDGEDHPRVVLGLEEAGPDRGWEASYPGRTDQVRHVRAAVRDHLRDCPASDEVVLLVELCANAVQFSGSGRPGGSFAVRVEHVAGRYVRAEVRDQGGDGWDGDLAGSARHPHGLYLLLRMASECGVSGDGGGHARWYHAGR